VCIFKYPTCAKNHSKYADKERRVNFEQKGAKNVSLGREEEYVLGLEIREGQAGPGTTKKGINPSPACFVMLELQQRAHSLQLAAGSFNLALG
jgi:hypothetical protein